MAPTPLLLHEQFLAPPAGLRPFVRHFVLLTVSAGAAPAVRTLLPDFQVMLLFNLGPPADIWLAADEALTASQRLTGALLVGPLKTAARYRLPGGARLLAVNFTLAGFYRLFQVPASHLPGVFTDPDAVLPHGCFARLWEQLRALPPAAGPAPLVAALAAFCRPYLRPPEAAQAALLAQLPLLAQRGSLDPLKVMAAGSRLSARTLQLRFRKYLGFSAKEAARFLRFRRLTEHLRQGRAAGKEDWLSLLEQYDYYDQSHLIHDFTYFLHQSPTKAAAQLRLGADAICLTRTELL